MANNSPWVLQSRERRGIGLREIARRFFHELLALTFQDPAHYERIREDDRISLLGLAAMAPGKPVECRVQHADGETEVLWLSHTFSASQLEWFHAGSALTVVHKSA